MPPLRPTLILSVLLLLQISCGGDPADQIRTRIEKMISWAATAHMTGDAWIAGATPGAFAQRTLEAARQAIAEEIGNARQQPPSSPGQAGAVPQQLQALEQTIALMTVAVQTRDRAAMARHMALLSSEEHVLRLMTKRDPGRAR